jgi:hypothetical protein
VIAPKLRGTAQHRVLHDLALSLKLVDVALFRTRGRESRPRADTF